ncbi:MAG: hypothetical protein KGH67_00265 [Candidatus Micrarchaeota archaeon]|nr:hypothetical protein [Candidatus Micrarchaeota archaeon]MDE1858946.1 hypothetical protein [Candidatus Micrarchaeota archaeon]
MKSEILNTAIGFIPILLGLAVLLLSRSITLITPKIQIETSSIESLIETDTFGYEEAQTETVSLIKDLLIVKGKLPKSRNIKLLKYAIKNAGIITCQSFQDKQTPTLLKTKKIILLFRDQRLVTRLFASPSSLSGILLTYHIDGNLNLVTS